ncbi:MAG: hypothetical protein HXY41_04410 [Chloroflexi bacterium]|nr:hypothetical protein [Chloroflexota bacterium]
MESLRSQYAALLESFSSTERALYIQVWRQLARHKSPVVARSFLSIGQNTAQQIIRELSRRNLLWFDDELHAVLQCPPFSALHTPHEVKAFGWERAYVTSFVDIPLTLLIYGPNVWLEATSCCPRSGEKLAFRIQMDEEYRLRWEVPLNDWRLWFPLPTNETADSYQTFHQLRPRLNAFYTIKDLDTHRQYQGDQGGGQVGAVYTLEQALYLGQCLLQAGTSVFA